VDVIYSTPDKISHRYGSNPAGLNALFGDGHVVWQGVKVVPDAFDENVWAGITAGNNPDLMFVQSLWRP
jgi:prepilin-type processing-associated H-X9-DG protein